MSKLQNRGSVSTFGIFAGGASAFSGALVNKIGSSSLNLTGVSAVEMTYGTEVYDVGDWFDTGSSTTDLVVPTGVTRVQLYGTVELRAESPGTFPVDTAGVQMYFRRNGVRQESYGSLDFPLVQDIFSSWTMISAVLDVVAGDTLSFVAAARAIPGGDSIFFFAGSLNSFGVKAVTNATAASAAGVLVVTEAGVTTAITNQDIFKSTSSGTITANLPALAVAENKRLTIFSGTLGGTVTVDPNGAETINGTATENVTGGNSITIYPFVGGWDTI